MESSSSGFDAFAEVWANTFGLFVPPITVICMDIKKMITDKAYGELVLPCVFHFHVRMGYLEGK